MIDFKCTVQEGCIADDLHPDLASAIREAYSRVLDEDSGPVSVAWTVIPKGFGFRGGRPSTTSMVRGTVPDGCDQATRERLLRAVGDAWCRVSGARDDEVIVSSRDRSWTG